MFCEPSSFCTPLGLFRTTVWETLNKYLLHELMTWSPTSPPQITAAATASNGETQNLQSSSSSILLDPLRHPVKQEVLVPFSR